MVFAGVYPVEADQYEDLRASLEKLQLNDASLTFEPESSLALGFGFRCGFLGLLHMEIIQERLYREFDMDVITTVPNVSYKITTTQGDVLEVHNPSGLPEITKIASIEEPYILAQIITKSDFLGNVLKLCIDKRGIMKNQTFITQDRVEVNFEMPLSEIVFDFYDKLKSISKGYASFDYHRIGFRPSKLAKLDILLNGEPVDALSSLIYADHAYDFGRRMCEKLKELIPRQQFDIAIQAAIGAKIIARETVKAVRKDVTAKCYGGDISRKRKLLEKQKSVVVDVRNNKAYLVHMPGQHQNFFAVPVNCVSVPENVALYSACCGRADILFDHVGSLALRPSRRARTQQFKQKFVNFVFHIFMYRNKFKACKKQPLFFAPQLPD